MTGALLAATASAGSLSNGHATIPDIVTFVVAAAMVLAGAIGVVTSRNPVHAALSLVLTLFGIAVLFVEQNADFLAAVQVIVYAGAIVVLFLFVIMFLGVDRRENVEAEPLKGQRPLAFLMIVVSVGAVFALAINAKWVTGAHSVAGSTTAGGHTNVYLLGQSVFTTYLFAFEATAALLIIAVVGAVFLARRPPGPGDVEEPEGPDEVDELAPGADSAGGADGETDVAPRPGPAEEQAPTQDEPVTAGVGLGSHASEEPGARAPGGATNGAGQ